MRSLPIAAAAAAAVVGSAIALAQDPKGTATVTETKTAAQEPAKGAAPAAALSEFKDVKLRSSYLIGFDLGSKMKAQGLDIDPRS